MLGIVEKVNATLSKLFVVQTIVSYLQNTYKSVFIHNNRVKNLR